MLGLEVQSKCPSVNAQVKKKWCIYTIEHYSATKKEDFLPFVIIWMYLEHIILNQTKKDKYCMISLICENKLNLQKPRGKWWLPGQGR